MRAFRHEAGHRKAFVPAERHEARVDVWKWRQLRNHWLRHNPLCEQCGRVAEVVHHRVPRAVAPHLTLSESNLASLCHECHDSIHAKNPTGFSQKSCIFRPRRGG